MNLGVMEGQGAYNRHARLQASGGAVGLPLLEQAAREVEPGQGPLLIADYGSSQGHNSLRPMRIAIAALRERFEPRPFKIPQTLAAMVVTRRE